jgi:hypothetical protein
MVFQINIAYNQIVNIKIHNMHEDIKINIIIDFQNEMNEFENLLLIIFIIFINDL